MERAGRQVAFPTVAQICDVNRRMVEEYGGLFIPPDNLHNLSALEYVLQAISSSTLGSELYPTLKDKAAALAYHVITRHVFVDGNKRTGIHVAWEFLQANGVAMALDRTIVELAEALAKDDANFGTLLRWLHEHQADRT